jgi:hypothetical protein
MTAQCQVVGHLRVQGIEAGPSSKDTVEMDFALRMERKDNGEGTKRKKWREEPERRVSQAGVKGLPCPKVALGGGTPI